MATIRMPILGTGTVPDASGDVFFQPLSNVAPTNDLYDTLVLTFNDTANKDEVNGSFVVPKNYAGTSASIVVQWAANATSGNNVVFDFDFNAMAAGESTDPSAHTSVTVTDADSTTAMGLVESSITLTAADLVADDLVLFQFGRDGAIGGPTDNLAAAVAVFSVLLQYDT